MIHKWTTLRGKQSAGSLFVVVRCACGTVCAGTSFRNVIEAFTRHARAQ